MTEAELQRRILAALGSERDLLILTNSVGRASYLSDDGRPYTVPYGLGEGSPDLVGMLLSPSGLACWFCLENKLPGEKPRANQEKCHAIWRRFGALIYVAHSVEEAKAALTDARALLRQRAGVAA